MDGLSCYGPVGMPVQRKSRRNRDRVRAEVRGTLDEFRAWREAARAEGVSMSRYALAAIAERVPRSLGKRPVPPVDQRPELDEADFY